MGCGGSKEPTQNTPPAQTPPQATPQESTQPQPPKQPTYKPPPGFPTPKLLEQAQREYAKQQKDAEAQQGASQGADGAQTEEDSLAPKPPTQTRHSIFQRDDYADVRENVLYEPKDLALDTPRNVSKRLCSFGSDDVGKLYALFSWVLYAGKHPEDFDLDDLPPRESVLYQLFLAHAGYTTYNNIFKALCSLAGFNERVVEGNMKTVYDANHVVGSSSSWLAVLVNDQWFLIDVNFAIKTSLRSDLVVQESSSKRQKASKQSIDEYQASDFYFLADPTSFIFTHFTVEKEWQLLARPVDFEEFKAMANLSEFYFLLGFTDVQKANGVLMTEDGHVTIKMRASKDRKLKLFANMIKIVGKESLTEMNNVEFSKLITLTSEEDLKTIDIDFLHIGRYSVKVWAVDIENDPSVRRLVGQWFVQVTKPKFMWQAKPENPLVEYGSSAELQMYGISMVQENITNGLVHVSFTSDEKIYEYQFRLENKELSKAKLKQTYKYYVIEKEAGILIKFVRHGKYYLHVLVKEMGSKKAARQVCTLEFDEPIAYHDPTPFPPATNGRIGYVPEIETPKLIPVSHPTPFFQITEASEYEEFVMQSSIQFDIMTYLEVSDFNSKGPEEFSSYVWLQVDLDEDYLKYTFYVRLPRAGLYALTLYGRNLGSKGIYRELYKYMFQVEETKKCFPFPACHENWSTEYKLSSPTNGYLKEHTEENLTVDIANATEVVTFHSGSPKFQSLQFTNGGKFSRRVATLYGDSTLTVAGRFTGEKDIKNLIHYEVLNAADWEEFTTRQQEYLDLAREHKEALQAYKELEEKEAEERAQKLEKEMHQQELRWMEIRDEQFEEELRLQKEFEEQFLVKESEKEEKVKLVLSNEEKDVIVRREQKQIYEEQDEEIRRRRKMYKVLTVNLYRKQLRAAISQQDERLLETAIRDAKQHCFTTANCPDLKKAEKLLDVINTKKELKEANKERDVDTIMLLIDDIMEKRYHGNMQYEVSEGESIINAVTRAERLNAFILAMEKSTMSEVRSYQKPPAVVHRVMQATLLLLGDDEYTTSEWAKCAALARPYGAKGLNRRIQDFDMEQVHPEIRERVQEILEALDFKHVRRVSTGAATFYVWAMGLIDDYDQLHGGQDTSRSEKKVKPAGIARQREILDKGHVGPDVPEYEYGRYVRSQQTVRTSTESRATYVGY